MVYIGNVFTYIPDFMHKPNLDIDQLRELINKGKATDPLVFLESIMNGKDPRKLSSIYNLVREIDSFSDGVPSEADWREIVDHVSSNYYYHSVSLSDSIGASKTLSEYLFAKRKQIDMTGMGSAEGGMLVEELTEEEIEVFKEKFNEDF